MSVTYTKIEPNKPTRIFRSLEKKEVENKKVNEQPKKRGRPSIKNL